MGKRDERIEEQLKEWKGMLWFFARRLGAYFGSGVADEDDFFCELRVRLFKFLTRRGEVSDEIIKGYIKYSFLKLYEREKEKRETSIPSLSLVGDDGQEIEIAREEGGYVIAEINEALEKLPKGQRRKMERVLGGEWLDGKVIEKAKEKMRKMLGGG